ncbi:MAG: sodium/solute symporter, partial [Flavobacteriales bacterium]|nr:sodium/solute symporter [Flavobacteriales bacterium]
AYVLTKISATIFAGAVVFDTLLNVDFWVGAGLVVVFTGIFTIFGGLKAVVYTDLVQMFVLTAGSLALIYFGLDALGGWDVMVEKIESKGGAAKGNYLNLWNQDVANGGYPWTGVIFGAPILGVWYWCTDQFIVQRVLAAKDQSHARKGTIFAGFLKILPIFLFVLPGVIAFALHQQTGDLLPLKDGKLSHEAALPSLVVQYLPAGMKGLVAAGLLAALMSSLSSVFNSCSTLITFDFFKVRNPEANEKTLVRFGQWSTVALVIVGLFWIPIMASLIEDDGLFKYLQSIQAYISPPIAAAFVLGLLWKRLNAKGAMWTLWSGFILGMARFVLYIMTDKGATLKASMEADPGKSWYLGPIEWFTSMNFLHFALFLFIFCALVLIVVSYATKEDQNIDFDFGFKSAIANTNRGPIVLDAVLSGVLIIAVVIIWFIFSPIGIA